MGSIQKLSPVLFRFILMYILCGAFALLAFKRLFLGDNLCGIDDANIFFVYAKHFSMGHGFVYNIGSERVEGFTSLLWTLIVSAAFLLFSHPEIILLAISIFLLASAMTAVTLYLDRTVDLNWRVRLISPASVLFLSVTLLVPQYIAWSTFMLMDTSIYSMLLVILTVCLISLNSARQNINLSLLIFLLLLTRPEAMLWGIAAIALAWMKTLSLSGRRQAFQFISLPMITYAVTIAGLTLFRMIYFGYPLPNTYYAKVSHDVIYNITQGFKYFKGFALHTDGLVTLAILASLIQVCIGFYSIRKNAGNTGKVLTSETVDRFSLAVLIWTGLLIPVFAGGDHFGSYRFYQVIHPLLMLQIVFLGIQFVRKVLLLQKSTQWFVLSACAVLLFLVMAQRALVWRDFVKTSGIRHEFEIADAGRSLGKLMNQLFAGLPEYPAVGVITAGGVKFTYEGPVLDLMGLNNTAMGHSHGDRKGIKNHVAFEKDIFFTFLPEIVNPSRDPLRLQPFLYDSSKFNGSWFTKKALKGLFDDSRFQQLYQYARISMDSVQSSDPVCGFYHKEFLMSLAGHPYITVELPESAGSLSP